MVRCLDGIEFNIDSGTTSFKIYSVYGTYRYNPQSLQRGMLFFLAPVKVST